MNFIINYGPYILALIAIVFIIIYGCMTGKAKKWLEWAVAEAENQLGTGTGQLKLRQVYNWFTAQFPFFSKIVPFKTFSKWVDLALDWMRDQMEKNKDIKAVIEG